MNKSTSSSTADEQIIELLLQRETSGMSVLYDKYSGALFGTILRVVRSQEIAEEVLQDTFTKVWRNIESYDTTKGRLFTWLINIARNSAIDATRQKDFKRQNQSLDNVVNTIDTHQSASINPETIDMRQLAEKLPKEYKDLVDLIYFQGFTQSEAAEALNIPLGTVKTRVRTAIVRLREFFN